MLRMLNGFLERKPEFGILASVTGFFASILSILQAVGIVAGATAAIFGMLAGFYTWRIKRNHYLRLMAEHEARLHYRH